MNRHDTGGDMRRADDHRVCVPQGRRTPRHLRYCALSLALLACVPLAQAAEVAAGPADPQQAQTMPEPTMPAQVQASFVLRGVEFMGATGVPEQELQAAVADQIGTQVTFADLEQLAVHATEVYRKHGFSLVQVYVPVQEVVDGKVKLQVVEGQLGKVSIELDSGVPVTQERVAKTLAILEPGQPINSRKYERAMLLLSDLPGIKPQSSVTLGGEAGASDLSVHVTARERLQFGLSLDNFGTRDSGRLRVTGSMRWASPFDRGDNLDLRLMVAQGMHTAFGRLAYETPLGYSGLRVGAGVARVQYELGGAFAALEPTGTGNVADVSFSYPLIRQRTRNLFLRGTLDRKSLTDRFEAVGYETNKRIRGGSVGLAFEGRDRWGGGGYTSLNASLYHGSLDLLDPLAVIFDKPPFGYGTEGSFSKFSLQAARLQQLAPKLSVFLAAGLQRASKSLDTYEKLSLGGPKGVRAYATGEVLVDDGWMATAELRYSVNPAATVSLFYDAACGELAHKPRVFDGDLTRSLRGYGLGFSWNKPGQVSMTLSLAWRATRAGVTDGGDRNPRLFWTIQKAF